MWSFRFLETLAQDLRYGLRMSLKDKGFTIVAVLTLALGIGANTAIFSVVNALLLRPLPYRNPDQLVWITEFYTQPVVEFVLASHFSAWSAQSQTLDQIATYAPDNLTLTGAGETERLDANHVSTQFFTLLGAQLPLGRNFLPAEDRPGGEPAAIISHSLWQRRFNSDRQIIGRSITLNNQGYTVVGVLPPDFRFIHPFDVWTPLALDPAQGRGRVVNAIARLKPGVTREQAQAELETISRRIGSGASTDDTILFDRTHLISLHETRRRYATTPAHSTRRSQPDPVDRLRECRQFGTLSRGRATERICRARGARRPLVAIDSADADGELVAGSGRRRAWVIARFPADESVRRDDSD